jgi:hypothetical protein
MVQIMLLQNSLIMGGRFDIQDRYRELRLDVDNMSYEVCCFFSYQVHLQFMSFFSLCFVPLNVDYICVDLIMCILSRFPCFLYDEQELLELGERIGYVSTGLKEEEIGRCLRKIKLSLVNDLSAHLSKQVDRKCSICQVSL